jgi:hypothetical protein
MLREPLEVALELPDACRPIDHGPGEDIRYLALRMTKITLAPADADAGPRTANAEQLEQREALMNMQSLGINCEFGFLQRSAGAEPLGLFRWTLAPLSKLVPALEQGFEGLANPDALEIFMNDATEFIVEDKLFGFRHHSFLFASKGGTLEKVKRNEYLRVGLLARSLVEEMREQRKLFVYHDAGESTLEDVRRLAGALNRYGANTLLWIVGAPHVSLVGEVRQLEPGLIQGYVSGFQLPVWEIFPVSAHRPSWLAVACRAYRLWRDLKPAPRALAEESRAMPAQPSGAAMKVALP